MRLLIGLVFYCSICACSNNVQEEYAKMNTFGFEKIKTIRVELDAVTSVMNSAFGFLDLGDKSYLTLLNRFDNKINFYDAVTGSISFKIQLDVEGPNGVGKLDAFSSGYLIHNFDSIFVYNRKRRVLHLLDSSGNLYNKWDYSNELETPSPYTPPGANMYLVENQLHLLNVQSFISYAEVNSNFRNDYARILDLRTEETNYFMTYPERFKEGAWGFNFYNKSWSFNPIDKELVVSFSIDPSLYRYSLKGELLGQFQARTKELGLTKPMSEKQIKRILGGDREQSMLYLLSQPSFGYVYFDPYRKLYLRSVSSGISQSVLNEGPPYIDKNSLRGLIVLDEAYEYVGFIKLWAELDHFVFFTSNGINLIRVDSESEDHFFIDLYVTK